MEDRWLWAGQRVGETSPSGQAHASAHLLWEAVEYWELFSLE